MLITSPVVTRASDTLAINQKLPRLPPWVWLICKSSSQNSGNQFSPQIMGLLQRIQINSQMKKYREQDMKKGHGAFKHPEYSVLPKLPCVYRPRSSPKPPLLGFFLNASFIMEAQLFIIGHCDWFDLQPLCIVHKSRDGTKSSNPVFPAGSPGNQPCPHPIFGDFQTWAWLKDIYCTPIFLRWFKEWSKSDQIYDNKRCFYWSYCSGNSKVWGRCEPGTVDKDNYIYII